MTGGGGGERFMRKSLLIANEVRTKGSLQDYFLLKSRVWHVHSQSSALLV